MAILKAQRSQVKLRLALAGASGSGKTRSALLLASGMVPMDKVVVIDSEQGSSNLYSDLGGFSVLKLDAPYSPEHYIEAIKECEAAGFELIILDGISQEWENSGGVLDIHSKMLGNSFTNWAKLTPRHNAFMQAILQSPCHTIATVRKKTDYSMDKDSNGKTTITKVGLKEVAREGTDFEWTLEFTLDQNHMAEATKDRTNTWDGKPPFVITKGTGRVLLDWCNAGAKTELPGIPANIVEDVKQAIK